MAISVNNANLVFKDSDGNVGKINSLTDNDIAVLQSTISQVEDNTLSLQALIADNYVTIGTDQTINGTKTFKSIPLSVTPSASSNSTEVATTAFVKKFTDSEWADTATKHGNIYRGHNLLDGHFASITAVITAIANGDFSDIYVGDYIPATYTVDGTSYTSNFRIAGINFFKAAGGAWGVSTPHVVLVPDSTFGACMNDTNTTEGGYVGSKMYTTTLPKLYNALAGTSGTPFYGHIKGMTESLTNGITASYTAAGGIPNWTGAANYWSDYTDQKLTLMNEAEIYGYRNFGNASDNVRCCAQLPMFRLKPETITVWGSQNTWLRSVASGAHFCYACYILHASYANASFVYAVRPRFVIG